MMGGVCERGFSPSVGDGGAVCVFDPRIGRPADAARHTCPHPVVQRLRREAILDPRQIRRITRLRAMGEYRAYVIGADGHIALRVDLVVPDETTARKRANKDRKIRAGTVGRLLLFPHQPLEPR
jgi:hypothetical protein